MTACATDRSGTGTSSAGAGGVGLDAGAGSAGTPAGGSAGVGGQGGSGGVPTDAGSADSGPADAGSGDAGMVDAAPPGPLDDVLRLDHIQVRGTQNSYHVKNSFVFHPSYDYTHQPLDVQLGARGVRDFEIDIHKDSRSSDELSVYHIFGIDPRTTCSLFTDCLQTIRTWSVVTKINDPTSSTEHAAAQAAQMLVASNFCHADESDAECTATTAIEDL